MMTRRDASGLAVFVALCLGVAALGGLFTSSTVGTWYTTLDKPPWNPPSWVFGPVWTTLYLMMAAAGWLVWRRASWSGARRALGLFGVQLALNLAWSALFFGLERPDLALIDIVLLLAAIAATIHAFRVHSVAASLLLAPYLAWVAYATTLNAAIWELNR